VIGPGPSPPPAASDRVDSYLIIIPFLPPRPKVCPSSITYPLFSTTIPSIVHRIAETAHSTLHPLRPLAAADAATTMPGLTLPNVLSSDVQSRNSEESCYVTIGTKVYDVTSFLDDHPGGGDLILDYGGKDVTKIM